MKNKYISAFAIAVSFGLLVGCSNKTDDVISDNVQTQAVESSESVVETVETASQNESAETAESTPTTESVEVSKEDEATYLMNKYPGFPKDPRQMTVAEYTAYMEAYFSNQNNTYSDATGMTPEIEEDHEYTQEEVAAIFAANGIGVTYADADVDTSALDGLEIDWD